MRTQQGMRGRINLADRSAGVGPVLAAAAVAAVWFAAVAPGAARAGLVYDGSTGGISFGVTNYGGGSQVTPRWLGNNFTGLNDILASPGGTFQLANPVVANNTSQSGIGNFASLTWSQVGGGNAHGPFGAGAGQIIGPAAAFAIADATPGGGGSASYGVESWVSRYTEVGGYSGSFGTYLSIGGSVPIIGSAAVAGLQTEVSFHNPNGVVNNYVLAPLILAVGDIGGGNDTFVAIGGPTGHSAGIVYNPFTTSFVGLATDNYLAVIPNGTQITVTSTLTMYADPASIDLIPPDPSLFPGIDPIPGLVFMGTAVPEPSSVVMGVTALAVLFAAYRFRRGRVAARVSPSAVGNPSSSERRHPTSPGGDP